MFLLQILCLSKRRQSCRAGTERRLFEFEWSLFSLVTLAHSPFRSPFLPFSVPRQLVTLASRRFVQKSVQRLHEAEICGCLFYEILAGYFAVAHAGHHVKPFQL